MTPINAERLRNLLIDSGYNRRRTEFLYQGFTQGFDMGYAGPLHRADFSENLPFRGVGNQVELWNKVMKEVKLNRYAGPFERIPFDNFIQSPIGLVPKGQDQTRLIFHLSYDFKDFKSFNYYTPDQLCKVKYRDLDHAVRNCLHILKENPSAILWYGVSDLQSAFRAVPGRRDQWCLLMMKARQSKNWHRILFRGQMPTFWCRNFLQFVYRVLKCSGPHHGTHYRYQIQNYELSGRFSLH